MRRMDGVIPEDSRRESMKLLFGVNGLRKENDGY
jgi:hypothetical protein